MVEALPDKSIRSRFQLPIVPFEYYIHLIFRPHYCSAIDTATNRYEKQVCLLGIKGQLRRADNFTTSFGRMYRNSGSFILLETSDSVQVCNGISNKLCCSMYCLYKLVLYCTAVSGCQPNLQLRNISYHILSNLFQNQDNFQN